MAYDDEKKLEESLRSAFPLHKTPESFKQSLKQELLSMPKKSKKKVSWLYTATTLAAVIILTIVLWPRESQAPIPPVNLPTLPPLTSTGRTTGGASPGPGFEVDLSYTIGPISTLPAQASAYYYEAEIGRASCWERV